ncbi:hypothetical protein [Edwardsiella tarda]|uniref:hypothetical protein n=1 Tax=Edwardsiella tarda TaxID=636 RepID=UPI00083B0452|nr:hypothetical protein [Edwardsiella tarda]
MLQLSLKLGVPVFEIEQWPLSVIAEYKAENMLMPFTDAAQAYRDGLALQFMYNQNVTKRHNIKYYDDLLPYLKQDQDWYEHEVVVHTKKTLAQVSKISEFALSDVLDKVNKAIEEERAKDDPDQYLIVKLSQLYREYNSKAP